MKTDKKNEDGKINFTLLEAIGKSSINHYPEVDLITASLDFYNEQYEQYLEAGGKN